MKQQIEQMEHSLELLREELVGKTIVEVDGDKMLFTDGSSLEFYATTFFPDDREFIFIHTKANS